MFDRAPFADMKKPVRCRCGSVYDLAECDVQSTHIDCSTWRTPCCGQLADDRRKGFGIAGATSVEWYTELPKGGPRHSHFVGYDGAVDWGAAWLDEAARKGY